MRLVIKMSLEDHLLKSSQLSPMTFLSLLRLDILHEVAIWQKNFKRIVSVTLVSRSGVG